MINRTNNSFKNSVINRSVIIKIFDDKSPVIENIIK